MTAEEIQRQCEVGQSLLMKMQYLDAEATLANVEHEAWAAQDWDALARLYMPLQEARRQRRQRCGEGIICLDLISQGPSDAIEPLHVPKNFPHGQLLVAGWGTSAPAQRVRALAAEHQLYLDTFLGAAYPTNEGIVVAIIPLAGDSLVPPEPRPIESLRALLPRHALLLRESELPRGSRSGTFQTYGQVMAIWERLHRPFLAEADAQDDPIRKMEGYRQTIAVDYACELAHQKLSDVARSMLSRSQVPGAGRWGPRAER